MAVLSATAFPDRMYDAVAEWLQVKYGDARMPDYYWPADAASLLILVRGMLAEVDVAEDFNPHPFEPTDVYDAGHQTCAECGNTRAWPEHSVNHAARWLPANS